MKVYSLNKIPCIYLYPENLGIFEYIFHKRMIKELEQHNLKFQLLQYKWKRFSNLFHSILVPKIILPLLIIFLITQIESGLTNEMAGLIYAVILVIVVTGLFELIIGFIKYMVINR